MNVIVMPLCSPPPISEMMFLAWIAQAAAGEHIEYFRGHLCIDRAGYGRRMTLEERRELNSVSTRAMKLAEQGLIHLVQRRIGPGEFSYVAIARPRRSSSPVFLSKLIFKEAA
jgi:hypothetical protein